MINHKLGRNIWLAGVILSLFAIFRPRETKDLTSQILFGIQGVLFLIAAYIQQKETNKKAREKEDERNNS